MNTLFEYITTILAICLTLSIIAYMKKRSENMELKRELVYLKHRFEKVKLQLEALAKMKSNIDVTVGDLGKGNLDLQILELYSKGYSYGMIAKKLGISKSTVYRRLKTVLNMKHKGKEAIALETTA
mgnify:CR=1 FL=1